MGKANEKIFYKVSIDFLTTGLLELNQNITVEEVVTLLREIADNYEFNNQVEEL
jgi:hypothetical protein